MLILIAVLVVLAAAAACASAYNFGKAAGLREAARIEEEIGY